MRHRILFFASLVGASLVSATAQSSSPNESNEQQADSLPSITAPAASRVAASTGLIEVPGERIALGQLDPTLPREIMAVDVAPAPFPGKTSYVTRDAVRLALERAGHDPGYASGLPVRQKVRRAARTLTRVRLEEELREKLNRKLPVGVVVENITGLQDVLLPLEEHRLEVRLNQLRRSTPATLMVRTNDRRWATLNLTLLLGGQAQLPALRSDLPKTSVIKDRDLIMVPTKLENVSQRSALRREQLVGKKLLQPLKAKQAIRRNTVKTPPTINRGREVILVVQGAGVRVSQPAIADEEGLTGEWIRVRPIAGTRPVRAKIVSSSRVVMNIATPN